MSKYTTRDRLHHVQRTWWVMSRRGRVWAVLYVAGIEPWAWLEDAHISAGDLRGLLGECDDGFIYVPSKTRADWWDRRYNWRNPTHWRFWLKSRITNRVVMLEVER